MRSELQLRISRVGSEVFGSESVYNRRERLLRFFEEVCELVRAGGLTGPDMHRILNFELSRPVGDSVIQEIGGAGVTLNGVATAFGLDLNACITLEIDRVEQNKEAIREKARKKPLAVHEVAPI